MRRSTSPRELLRYVDADGDELVVVHDPLGDDEPEDIWICIHPADDLGKASGVVRVPGNTLRRALATPEHPFVA